jgi:hypothetical protein
MKVALLSLAFVSLGLGTLQAAPRAHLEAKADRIGTIIVNGLSGYGPYLYFTYTVTNPTDKELSLFLDLTVETDTPNKYRNGVDPAVEQAVKQRLKKDFLDISQMRSAKIAPGETKDCIAVFGRVDPAADVLNVVIRGLVDRVAFEKGKRVIEDRALVFKYLRPGDEYHPVRAIHEAGKEWRVIARDEKTYS